MTSTNAKTFAVYEKIRSTEEVKPKEVFDNFHDAENFAEDLMDIYGEDRAYKVIEE